MKVVGKLYADLALGIEVGYGENNKGPRDIKIVIISLLSSSYSLIDLHPFF